MITDRYIRSFMLINVRSSTSCTLLALSWPIWYENILNVRVVSCFLCCCHALDCVFIFSFFFSYPCFPPNFKWNIFYKAFLILSGINNHKYEHGVNNWNLKVAQWCCFMRVLLKIAFVVRTEPHLIQPSAMKNSNIFIERQLSPWIWAMFNWDVEHLLSYVVNTLLEGRDIKVCS